MYTTGHIVHKPDFGRNACEKFEQCFRDFKRIKLDHQGYTKELGTLAVLNLDNRLNLTLGPSVVAKVRPSMAGGHFLIRPVLVKKHSSQRALKNSQLCT